MDSAIIARVASWLRPRSIMRLVINTNARKPPAVPNANIYVGIPKAATLHVVPGAESHPVEEVASLTSPQTTGESTNSPAAVIKVAHGPRSSPHEPVLHPPVSGQPSGPNAACATSVISGDLTRLIFRNGESSPASDVPSLSDGDSDPPSAPCEVPEFPERWPGSASVPSPVVYCNPSPGFFSPGAPFVHPAYVPWTLPKPPARSDSRRQGMTARKMKALKSTTLLLPICHCSQLTSGVCISQAVQILQKRRSLPPG